VQLLRPLNIEERNDEESSCITQCWDCAVEGSPSCTAEVGCCTVAVGCCTVAVGCCTEEHNGVSCTKRTADCFGALEDNHPLLHPEGGALTQPASV